MNCDEMQDEQSLENLPSVYSTRRQQQKDHQKLTISIFRVSHWIICNIIAQHECECPHLIWISKLSTNVIEVLQRGIILSDGFIQRKKANHIYIFWICLRVCALCIPFDGIPAKLIFTYCISFCRKFVCCQWCPIQSKSDSCQPFGS